MSDQTPRECELALEAYKLLVGTLEHEEALFWKRNEIFLVVNGGLVAILGLIQSPDSLPGAATPLMLRPIFFLIPAIGIIMCLLWFIIVRRGQAFYDHWYEQLKFLEREYLAPIRVFQLADEYFAKGHIKLGGQEFTLDVISKRLHIYHAFLAAPAVFLIAWLGLLFYVFSVM